MNEHAIRIRHDLTLTIVTAQFTDECVTDEWRFGLKKDTGTVRWVYRGYKSEEGALRGAKRFYGSVTR
jgi:hypothetical protein